MATVPKMSKKQLEYMRKKMKKYMPVYTAQEKKVGELVRKHGMEGCVPLMGYFDELMSDQYGHPTSACLLVCLPMKHGQLVPAHLFQTTGD